MCGPSYDSCTLLLDGVCMNLRVFVLSVCAVALGALTTVGCSDDKSSLTAPITPAAPTVTALSITGSAAVRTNFFANYTVIATMSDGTTQPATTATWSSSNSSTATVDATGRVDALSHGSINLTASYQGRTASKNISVVNNYGGSWNGTYVIRACDQAGIFASIRWCQNLGGVGTILPITLALTQSGNDRG